MFLLSTYEKKKKLKLVFKDTQLLNFCFTVHKLKLGKKMNESIENMSDKENDIFTDSSLELFDTLKPKLKTKINSKNNSKHVMLDTIDLTNESYLGFEDIKIKKNKKKDSLIVFNSNSSRNEMSSNESFKSATNLLFSPNNNYQDLTNVDTSPVKLINSINSEISLSDSIQNFSKLECNDTNYAFNHVEDINSEFQNNYTTPKVKNNQTSDLSESAKLLDRIYGYEWRHIDGVIKVTDKKHLNKHFDE
jgi:hypothetical protein